MSRGNTQPGIAGEVGKYQGNARGQPVSRAPCGWPRAERVEAIRSPFAGRERSYDQERSCRKQRGRCSRRRRLRLHFDLSIQPIDGVLDPAGRAFQSTNRRGVPFGFTSDIGDKRAQSCGYGGSRRSRKPHATCSPMSASTSTSNDPITSSGARCSWISPRYRRRDFKRRPLALRLGRTLSGQRASLPAAERGTQERSGK